MKWSTVLFLGTLAMTSGQSAFAGPLPDMADEREHFKVEGPRIRPIGKGDYALSGQPASPGSLGGGGPASKGSRNANGKSKAEKAKNEAKAGDSAWWGSLSKFFKKIGSGVFDIGYRSKKIDKEGNVIEETSFCLDMAVNTENNDVCSQVMQSKQPDGSYIIEFNKLIALQHGPRYILGYSSDDTISFQVSTIEELEQIFRSVDPNFGL